MTTPHHAAALLGLALLSTPLPLAALEGHVGAGFQQFGYRELSDSGAELNREDGLIPGVAGQVDHELGDWRIEGLLGVHRGEVDYRGRTQGGAPFTTRTEETLWQARLRLGRNVPLDLGPVPHVTVYGGLGYRRWHRDIQGRGNVRGLSEVYQWSETGLGLRLPITYQAHRAIRLDLEGFYVVDPTLDVTVSGFDPSELELQGGPGIRGSLSHIWRLASGWRISLSAFAERWGFGRSADEPLTDEGITAGSIHEPRSESRHWGLGLSSTYRF